MKYDWCVCDMDGTLLNSEDIITAENEAALKNIQKCGTQVILASGRIDLMMKRFIKQLDLQGYVISCNGGLIRNIQTGEIVYAKFMGKEDVLRITNYCMDHSIHFLIYTPNTVYSNKNNPRAIKYENLNKIVGKDLQVPLEYLDNTMIYTIQDINVTKILLVCDNDEEVRQLQNKFSEIKTLTVVSSEKGLLDMMAFHTSKGCALKFLSEKLKVSLKNVVAFGDNYNDIEMLQCVGMPIAMGNAVEELKTMAKFITLSNDASGVAYAINHLI